VHPLIYAHREWSDESRQQYGSYAPSVKLRLDSATSTWHWER
jgi:hypothetical protein